MRDLELDALLKSVPVPPRDELYWRDFPKRLAAELLSSPALSGFPKAHRPGNLRLVFAAWGLGLAAACVILGFAIGYWRGRDVGVSAAQLAQAGKFYREVETLFPNQIQAIVFDQGGPRLILAARPDVANSQPFFLKICTAAGCERVITFSGQQVRLLGRDFEVLAEASGGVMLVGPDRVWTGGSPDDAVRVQASPLATSL